MAKKIIINSNGTINSQGRKKSLSSKTNNVFEHLKKHGSITTWEAIERYRATRLSAIIYNLRAQGMNISSVTKKGKDGVYVEYRWLKHSDNSAWFKFNL